MLQLRGAEVTRLGDLHRNWAKVQRPRGWRLERVEPRGLGFMEPKKNPQ